EINRRGPRPMLRRRLALVAARTVVAVAKRRLDALARGVALALDRLGVDRVFRLLDRLHVVDRITLAPRILRIGETERAAVLTRRARLQDAAILNRGRDVPARRRLRANLHNFDARDHAALVRGIVALARTDVGDALLVETRLCELRTTGLLLEGA